MDTHTVYILSIVIIICIFVLLLLGMIAVIGKYISSEFFSDIPEKQKEWTDTIVPRGLTYNCGMKSPLMKGTSMVDISRINAKRFPIAIETPWNWYSTQ